MELEGKSAKNQGKSKKLFHVDQVVKGVPNISLRLAHAVNKQEFLLMCLFMCFVHIHYADYSLALLPVVLVCDVSEDMADCIDRGGGVSLFAICAANGVRPSFYLSFLVFGFREFLNSYYRFCADRRGFFSFFPVFFLSFVLFSAAASLLCEFLFLQERSDRRSQFDSVSELSGGRLHEAIRHERRDLSTVAVRVVVI